MLHRNWSCDGTPQLNWRLGNERLATVLHGDEHSSKAAKRGPFPPFPSRKAALRSVIFSSAMNTDSLDSTMKQQLEEGRSDEDANVVVYDEKEAKAILRKVDYRLIPMLTLLYVLSFLDRSNSKLHSAGRHLKCLTTSKLAMPRLQA